MHDTSTLVPEHIGPKLVSTSAVRVIAIIDGEVIAPPPYVDGLSSATAWLDNMFPDASQATFHKAEKLVAHPTLICGGVYGSCGELAFLKRRAGA